jgi:hypothetical protein
MITESDMEAAFEAGIKSAERARGTAPFYVKTGDKQRLYENWRRWYYHCQDCGQDLLGIHRHECPARRPHPYRAKGTTP